MDAFRHVYDKALEVIAAVLMVAGALAALRGAHLGFPGFVNSLPANLRVAATIASSAVTIGFFILLAITGYQVMNVIAGLTLVSLPEVDQSWVASVVPIASVLFVISELLRLPAMIEEARRGPIMDAELKEALEGAQAIAEQQSAEARRP